MILLAAICVVASVLVASAAPQRERLARLIAPSAAPQRSNVPTDPFVGAGALFRPILDRRGRTERTRQAVVDAADAWASELQAGRSPAPALALALEQAPAPFPGAGERIRLGSDPLRVLRDLSMLPGAEGFASLAACWTVAATAGTGLAEPARRVALGLRDQRSVQVELQAQVAAPKATARLVASLPILGPVLGVLIGADTIAVLVGTPIGRGCLMIGIALNLAGVWWVRRIIASAAMA